MLTMINLTNLSFAIALLQYQWVAAEVITVGVRTSFPTKGPILWTIINAYCGYIIGLSQSNCDFPILAFNIFGWTTVLMLASACYNYKQLLFIHPSTTSQNLAPGAQQQVASTHVAMAAAS
jgi:hypothetical protein